MADIQLIPAKNKNSVKPFNKKKISVDLTPMVDLGFLLIAFFILTTSMSTPAVSKLIMPKDNKDSMEIPAGGSLTFLNGGNNTVAYYCGELDHTTLQYCTYSNIRQIILDKKKSNRSGNLFITIKSGSDCTYKNMVDMLDEMNINDVKRYAFSDMNSSEKKLFGQVEKDHLEK